VYKFTRKEKVFLGLQRVGRIAQVGEDGLPHTTPLCHVFSKGALYIETGVASWKVRALNTGNQVAYVVDEYTEDWDSLRGVRLHGTAEVLKSGKEYNTAKRLLMRKFPQFKAMGWKDGVQVVLKITPTRATSWGLE
jgi:nitroimidazol reductase NimA-like FMN-containing flavoprotein (pyridoxamine 5'-phosphate oxidase superfamily)